MQGLAFCINTCPVLLWRLCLCSKRKHHQTLGSLPFFFQAFLPCSALLCPALVTDGGLFLGDGGKQAASNSLPQSPPLPGWGSTLRRTHLSPCIPLEAYILLSPEHGMGQRDIMGDAMPSLARQRLPGKAASLSVPQAAHPAPCGAARWSVRRGTSSGHSPTTMGRHRLQRAAWLHLKLKHPHLLLSVQTTVEGWLTASPLNISGLGEGGGQKTYCPGARHVQLLATGQR